MKFKTFKRANPLKRSEVKFYARPNYIGTIKIDTLANEISKMCTLSTADVYAVIESLLLIFPRFLTNSMKIKLGDFGIFKISFSSLGKKKASDIKTKDIRDVKVLFLPGKKLKRALKDMKFQ